MLYLTRHSAAKVEHAGECAARLPEPEGRGAPIKVLGGAHLTINLSAIR